MKKYWLVIVVLIICGCGPPFDNFDYQLDNEVYVYDREVRDSKLRPAPASVQQWISYTNNFWNSKIPNYLMPPDIRPVLITFLPTDTIEPYPNLFGLCRVYEDEAYITVAQVETEDPTKNLIKIVFQHEWTHLYFDRLGIKNGTIHHQLMDKYAEEFMRENVCNLKK